jgi:NADH-quinone oxidoreductase subunit N
LSYTVSYKKKNDIEKLSAYECGFDPFGMGGSSFEVHFYIVGILFIIFDLEVIFLYPWAVYCGVLGGSGFCAILVFLGILTVGFIYEWKKGALDWADSSVEVEALLYKDAPQTLPPRVMCSVWNKVLFGETSLFRTYYINIFLILWRTRFRRFFYGMLIIIIPAGFFACVYGLLGEFSLLLIILILLLFAASGKGKRFEGWDFRTTVLDKQELISVYLILILSYVASTHLENKPAIFFYQQYLIRDFYAESIKIYLVICTIIFLVVSLEYLLRYSCLKTINLVEFPIVICFALCFMLLLVSSFNLFGAYVSLEGLTFSLYILAGMNYNSQNSIEAGIKYFCLGALSSGLLLFGIALLFIITKTLNFAELRYLFQELDQLPRLLSFSLTFIFFGFWFKLSIFPCHVWAPDVYEGVLTPVTLFFATVVKLSIFSFFVRVLFFLLGTRLFLTFWQPLILFVAAGSIVFGALGALVQTKLKRFVGYTAINQMGYLFIGLSSGSSLGLQSSFVFLYVYLITTLLLFAILLYVSDSRTGADVLFINQLNTFGQQHRNLSLILAIVLFSMAGIPPLAGFFGKFFLLFSAHQSGNHSLVFLGLVMNVISGFYYLQIVKCLFFEEFVSRESIYSFFLGDTVYTAFFNNLLIFFTFHLLLVPYFLDNLLLLADVTVSSSF